MPSHLEGLPHHHLVPPPHREQQTATPPLPPVLQILGWTSSEKFDIFVRHDSVYVFCFVVCPNNRCNIFFLLQVFCLLLRCHCNTNSEALNNNGSNTSTAKKKRENTAGLIWLTFIYSLSTWIFSLLLTQSQRVFVTPERLVKPHLADKHESVQIQPSAAVAGQTFAN